MPPLVLGMSIAEPSVAFLAVHGRRGIARLIVGRHGLTQALHVLALVFHFSHHRRGYLLQIHKAIVPLPEESYFVYGDGIGFSNTIKTCTAVFTVAVLIRIGRQPSAVCVASLLSIAGAVSLMIW